MSTNLLDAADKLLTTESVNRTASSANESPAKTRSAMQSAIPTVFAVLIAHVGKPGGADRVLAAVTGADKEPAKNGQSLLTTFAGDHSGQVMDALASSSGIRRSSSSGILAAVFPMIAGMLGKQVASRQLGASGLSELLVSQRKAVLEHPSMPAGLAGALGLAQTTVVGAAPSVTPLVTVTGAQTRETGVREPRPKGRFPWGLLAGLAGVCLVALGMSSGVRNCQRETVGRVDTPTPPAQNMQPAAPNMQPAVEAPRAPAEPAPAPAAAEHVHATPGHITLPNGHALAVDPNSQVASFARSVADPSVALPHTFPVDVNFETGKATTAGASNKSIDAVADVMKAYPNARVGVEGHTDATGTPEANKKLAAERANTVKHMLVQRGVAADRIEATGASAQAPTAPSDSEAERAQNRRVDLVLRSR